MKFIAGAILGAGVLIAWSISSYGTQQRLQADCHTYADLTLRPGLNATKENWNSPFMVAVREGVGKVLNLTEAHRRYCNW